MNRIANIISKAFSEQDFDDTATEKISDRFILKTGNKTDVTVQSRNSSEKAPQKTRRELGRIIDVSIADIIPNPHQPRKHFSIEELTSLAKSISTEGIIQPLTVRRSNSVFELISGERRLRAAKLAGLRSVPCIVINADERRSSVLALIENIQRSDLNCFEEAEAISRLIGEGGLSREEASSHLGMAQSTLANKLRLLKLTASEQEIIREKKMGERHARALLKIQDQELRKEILIKAAEGGWTVETLENYIMKTERDEVKKSSYQKRSVMLKDVRLFFNSVNKALNVMKMAGIDAETKKTEYEDYIEYVIKIPNEDKSKIDV